MTDVDSGPATAGARGCPVADFATTGPARPALAGYEELDQLRGTAKVHKVEEGAGFFLYTGYDQVLEISQQPKFFSNALVNPMTNELYDSGFQLVPQTLDPPLHTKWRRLLGSYFSPGRTEKLRPAIQARAVQLIDSFVDRGECDFVADFARQFPTAVFMENILGLDIEGLPQYMEWEQQILHPAAPTRAEALQIHLKASAEVTEFLRVQLDRQRALPEAERTPGLISEALKWKLDGEPLADEDLVSFYLLMFEAGLDTVTAEISWGMYHLARHPKDRQRIVDDPAIIPVAVEELLRVYPMVSTTRYVTADNDYGGCPLKKGDRVVLSLPSAGRDEQVYDRATEVDFDRGAVQHLTFGAGPHRCLGSHIAREELAIAYREFHKRIPNYRLADDAVVTEAHSLLMGLENLPLVWDV